MQQSAGGEVDLGFGLGVLRLRLRGSDLGYSLSGASNCFGFVFVGPPNQCGVGVKFSEFLISKIVEE